MNHRNAVITGLRDLAAFLEANPSIPVPRTATVHHFPHNPDDTALCAEVDQIAIWLGTTVDVDKIPHGHYTTSIHFGPVEYRAVAILSGARARHQAESSYYGHVHPE
ncbi:hypothetical protein [Nonomuraea endophytica]|uniref:Uncharacterized protein n=1 Tax=Nonomuraea endophytica TaxID=714136 RepID=A0A7W8A6T5_9ACTN|nr:hypothetical protein [Nonomuraea endophytica]MBB5080687.1 hypothetical protein [Nonomuraea endophytica]